MKLQKALQTFRDELIEFEDEFDVSDPEWTQVLFKTRVSNLISKGALQVKKIPGKVRLADIVEGFLDSKVDQTLLEKAEAVDSVLNPYGDEPSKDEMGEAQNSLRELIEMLNERVQQHS